MSDAAWMELVGVLVMLGGLIMALLVALVPFGVWWWVAKRGR